MKEINQSLILLQTAQQLHLCLLSLIYVSLPICQMTVLSDNITNRQRIIEKAPTFSFVKIGLLLFIFSCCNCCNTLVFCLFTTGLGISCLDADYGSTAALHQNVDRLCFIKCFICSMCCVSIVNGLGC